MASSLRMDDRTMRGHLEGCFEQKWGYELTVQTPHTWIEDGRKLCFYFSMYTS